MEGDTNASGFAIATNFFKMSSRSRPGFTFATKPFALKTPVKSENCFQICPTKFAKMQKTRDSKMVDKLPPEKKAIAKAFPSWISIIAIVIIFVGSLAQCIGSPMPKNKTRAGT